MDIKEKLDAVLPVVASELKNLSINMNATDLLSNVAPKNINVPLMLQLANFHKERRKVVAQRSRRLCPDHGTNNFSIPKLDPVDFKKLRTLKLFK